MVSYVKTYMEEKDTIEAFDVEVIANLVRGVTNN